MTKVHFLDDVFEVDAETALQVERWLDKQGYLEKIKQKGYYFQGLSFNDNPQGLQDILKYKTNVKDKEVWSLIFDLNYDDETLEQQDDTWQGGGQDDYSQSSRQVLNDDVVGQSGTEIGLSNPPQQSDECSTDYSPTTTTIGTETLGRHTRQRDSFVNTQQKNCHECGSKHQVQVLMTRILLRDVPSITNGPDIDIEILT